MVVEALVETLTEYQTDRLETRMTPTEVRYTENVEKQIGWVFDDNLGVIFHSSP